MTLRRLQDLALKGTRVLLRVDYNVPLLPNGEIADDTRIRESLPSIEYILKHGGSVILVSHFGRPKGGFDPKLSLAPCAERLSQLLHRPVQMAKDCIGPAVEAQARALKPGSLLMLENVRFYPAEEDPSLDPTFAEHLAQLGDAYVNDAFGTAHRAHSSTTAIAQYFPNTSAAGLLIQKEIASLQPILHHPKRPFYAIIGGAKISTKIGVLQALLPQIDGIFIGGAMAFTFLKARGFTIGDSLYEEEHLSTALAFLKLCHKLHLPKDLVIADRFAEDAQHRLVSVEQGIPDHWQGMDIGPETIVAWKKELSNAATIFWNGPLGVCEFAPFAKGTEAIAMLLAASRATTIIGGGDSVAAIHKLDLASTFSHLSTGGGACLEYIELGHLPGIDVLQA